MWIVANSDPHAALAFDRLHVNHGGLFSDHLWDHLQILAENAGRTAMAKIDEQYVKNCKHWLINTYYPFSKKRMAALPRWRNINHFSAVMQVHFTDGKKYQDISKVYTILDRI